MKIKVQIGCDIDVYDNLEDVYDSLDLKGKVRKIITNEADLEDIIKGIYPSWDVKVTLIQQYMVEYVTLFGKSGTEYFDLEGEAYSRFKDLYLNTNYVVTISDANALKLSEGTMIVKKVSVGKLDIQGNYTCMETVQMRMEYKVHNIIVE